MNLLEVQGLRKTYPAFRLEDVSFSVPEGAVISLPLRAEGMGKGRAFLSGMLSGIVEPEPEAIRAAYRNLADHPGDCFCYAIDWRRLSERSSRRRAGYQ